MDIECENKGDFKFRQVKCQILKKCFPSCVTSLPPFPNYPFPPPSSLVLHFLISLSSCHEEISSWLSKLELYICVHRREYHSINYNILHLIGVLIILIHKTNLSLDHFPNNAIPRFKHIYNLTIFTNRNYFVSDST